MPMMQFNLSRFLFPSDPALWACPIQEGLPFVFSTISSLLMTVASIAFVVGIIISVFYYLTTFGNEDRAKTAVNALKWTFIGALVVILSSIVIYGIAGSLAKEGGSLLPADPLNPISGECSTTPEKSSSLRLPLV